MLLFFGHDPGNSGSELTGALAALAWNPNSKDRPRLISHLLYGRPDRRVFREWFGGLEREHKPTAVYLCSEALFLGRNVATLKALQQSVDRAEGAADAVFEERLKTSELHPSTWHKVLLGDGALDHDTALLFAKGRASAIIGSAVTNKDLAVAICLAEYARVEAKWKS